MRVRPGSQSFVTVETEHKVMKFIDFWPAGAEHPAANPDCDVVRFIARDGGFRTCRTASLTLL